MQVLGFGDFYYELGVQIVEACLATRSLNGGLMEMKPLMRFVNVSPACLDMLSRCPGIATLHEECSLVLVPKKRGASVWDGGDSASPLAACKDWDQKPGLL